MTTPIPEKPSRRQRARVQDAERPRLRLGLMGFLVAWLLPNLVMAVVVMVLGDWVFRRLEGRFAQEL